MALPELHFLTATCGMKIFFPATSLQPNNLFCRWKVVNMTTNIDTIHIFFTNVFAATKLKRKKKRKRTHVRTHAQQIMFTIFTLFFFVGWLKTHQLSYGLNSEYIFYSSIIKLIMLRNWIVTFHKFFWSWRWKDNYKHLNRLFTNNEIDRIEIKVSPAPLERPRTACRMRKTEYW